MKHNRCNVVAIPFIRKYQFTLINIHVPIKSETIVHELRRNVVDLSHGCWRRWKSPFDRMKFRAECNSVRSLISKAESFFQSCNWIKCQSLHTLETHESYMPILAHPGNPSIQFFIKILQTHFVGPILTNLVNLSFWRNFLSSSKQASFQKTTSIHWSTDTSLSTDDLTTFDQFQTSTSFPECSKKPPTVNLTCPLTRCFFPVCLPDLSFYCNYSS